MIRQTILSSVVIGTVLLLATNQLASAEMIDIGSYFNQDTIINAPTDDTSGGYRPGTHYEHFATEAGSLSVTDGDGIDGDGSDIPNNGQLTCGLFDFAFGTLTGGTDNTILMNTDGADAFPSSIELDIADVSLNSIAVLYTGVGGVAEGQDGEFTVFYTDSSEVTYIWDLADWNTGASTGDLREVALGSGVDFYRNYNGGDKIINTTDGYLYCQSFDLDSSKTIDKVEFSLDGDVATGADIGIYALSGVVDVPEPGTFFMLLGIIAIALYRRR